MTTKERESALVQDLTANRLMDLDEVRTRLHIRKAFLFRLLKLGLLPFIKIGSRKKVSVFALNNFISKYETEDLMEDLRQRELSIQDELACMDLGG